MINYDLPESVELEGKTYAIRSDFRAVLDIFTALSDPELNDQARFYVVLNIFFEDFESIPVNAQEEALKACFWFISGGREDAKGERGPKLMDWAQDFPLIVAPVNRIIGYDIRGTKYLHWWTFLAAYNEIGDCTFSQVVRIRSLKSRGHLKDKSDIEWYKRNRELVDFPHTYTDAEKDLLKAWGGK